ncbi:MetQ/NlpA family ABC transporter substrate-binding protein [Corynebacterium diphtheriae]|uniref:Methionine ABC transporter substrate-binding protein n=1 Tax=Corynebacterium diphtheriae bv. gravis TaxID=1720349 RepID=A0AAX0J3C7_CORDP|nr:MetQ/NlpA family ABC transporter substrate-binding protein [Corynebacterium diphtheriae]AEX66761.1 D-methionine-binding lipoprotein [Corynebacterium diphtheriae C7 (beta)]ERA54180.1 D-methionine-binding lipoprotein [Corynebacterium diphtheriae str. Aberdeen]KLN42688.1 methionine ABC transporter substrate-binding protein [Corynebacterium diphtheriae bv. gravis str. ISS 4746]KLN45091.1 methionine ABC transporter substrate-binding protein [Corynebacterium diphtheriae bv. gravis str. ISS 4749]M
MKLRRSVALVSASLIAATGLVACSNSSDSSDQATVKIGTTDGSKKSWKVFEDKAKEAGIKLDIKNFSDYSTPNDALAQDQLDVNLFQHLKFLAEYNVGKNADLTPVGATEIVPLALFWKDHTSLDGIEGKSVAIPNDPSNQGRAINVLVQAKLITLKKEGLITPAPSDVDEAKSKVKLTPVDAAQTTTAYGEGTPAIINNSFLDRAGIDPKLSVFQDDPNSAEAEPYINAFVTKAEDKDDANIAKLVEIWHSKEVQDAVAEDSKGTSVPVQRTAEELKKILDRLEADQKK